MWDRMTTAALVLAAAAAVLALATPSLAEDACFTCHEKPHPDGDYMPIVRAAEYAASVHASVPCRECHKAGQPDGLDVVPHVLETQVPPTCQECHAEQHAAVVAEFERSSHSETVSKTFPCKRCHDVHTMLADPENADRDTRLRQANGPCIECHRDSVAKVGGLTGAVGITMAHSFLPNPAKHVRMRCVVCHTPVEQKGIHDVRPKAESERECTACHKEDSAYIGKFIGSEDRSAWITNPLLFDHAYVPGATRNRLVDRTLIGMLLLTALGILGHGLLRFVTRKRGKPSRVEKVYLYGVVLRLGHWANALLIIVLIVTGLRIHFGTRTDPLLDFETAFNVHNLAGAVLVLVGALFFLSTLAAGDLGQYLKWHPQMVSQVIRQIRWYLGGVFKGEAHPTHTTKERRFNPLQQLTYAGLMFGAYPAIIVSGAILLFPDTVRGEFAGHHGIWWIAAAHYLLGFGFLLFLTGHLYLITMGDRPSYALRSMVSGWHLHDVPLGDESAPDPEDPDDDVVEPEPDV